MEEYVSEALVLTKDPRGSATPATGFLRNGSERSSGKTTSSRRITSKLAGHLEPGTIANVRFIEKGWRADRGRAEIIPRRNLAPRTSACSRTFCPTCRRSRNYGMTLRRNRSRGTMFSGRSAGTRVALSARSAGGKRRGFLCRARNFSAMPVFQKWGRIRYHI